MHEMTLFSAMKKAAGAQMLSPISDHRGWWSPLIQEPYSGAWQMNDELSIDLQLAYSAVYACVNLRANDMAKLRHKLVERVGGIGKNWRETTSPAFSPFLRKPNRLQNHIQFKQWWAMSKLTHGNTYALKERDSRGVVVAEYILDPCRVTVLVTPDGSAYYQLRTDNLAGIEADSVTVPASEIVHDRMNCLFHPLVGVSPLYAAGLAAAQGLSIQRQSRTFFGNGARPSGILTAPSRIDQPTADRLLESWNNKFSGANSGKIAVLGDGLKFEQMTMNSTDAQMIEQLKWTAIDVCTAFQVPPWKIGIGTQPTYQNGELLNLNYYSDCLQIQIEEYELCQDEALGIGEGVITEGRELGVELDLKALLRMDSQTAHEIGREDIRGSVRTINEVREEFDLPPIEGGDVIWMQEQNHSLEALKDRDENDPFAKPEPAPPAQPPAANDEPTAEEALKMLFAKSPESLSHA
jgi:HK97 family phage portal protein